MKIGKLTPVMNGEKEELHGDIATLQMQMKIKLVLNGTKASENAPDYIIAAAGSSGIDIPVGGAWIKRKRQIGDIDLEFLSITIDDPSLPNPLNVTAFKNNEGGYDITWRRKQSNPASIHNQPKPENNENTQSDFS